MLSRLLRRVPGIVLGVAVLAGFAPPAAAQMSMSMGLLNERTAFTPDITPYDLDVFVRVLELGEAEETVMRDLYDAYATRLRSEGSELRRDAAEAIEKAEALFDRRIIDDMRDRVKAWQERKAKMEEEFLQDLTTLLTREQEARWPLVERELRRLKGMPNGWLSGESVDIIRLAGEHVPEALRDEPRIVVLLDRYSTELDRALQRRDAYIEEHEQEFMDTWRDRPEEAAETFREAQKLRLRVRDLNVEYLRRIGEALRSEGGAEGEKAADAMERAFLEDSARLLARDTRAESHLKAALALPSLTPDQRSALEAIRDEHEPKRWAIVAELAQIERDLDAESLPAELESVLAGDDPDAGYRMVVDGFPEYDPRRELRARRYRLDRQLRERVNAVLTDSQRDMLPDPAFANAVFSSEGRWLRL